MSGGGNIGALVAKLQVLGKGAVVERIAETQRGAAHDACLAGFVQQRNPYGTPWAPRKGKGTWPLLDKTGAGINSLTSRANSSGVLIRIKGYMRFHQSGTVRMVPRLIFPMPQYGLGMWAAPINLASANAVREMMR